ncbi:MAG: hypothetical protein A2328_03150 [Bdellovibrionales bacterium RIFOXYB2_FULL_36_6]|nr:MAG: hypothetical protein A2328_03150 [Bdellovibrionales bacterium RIFOXYB2_FULL_36_6]
MSTIKSKIGHDALGDIPVLEKIFERLSAKMSKDISPASVKNKMMEISSRPDSLSRLIRMRICGLLRALFESKSKYQFPEIF